MSTTYDYDKATAGDEVSFASLVVFVVVGVEDVRGRLRRQLRRTKAIGTTVTLPSAECTVSQKMGFMTVLTVSTNLNVLTVLTVSKEL